MPEMPRNTYGCQGIHMDVSEYLWTKVFGCQGYLNKIWKRKNKKRMKCHPVSIHRNKFELYKKGHTHISWLS